MSYKITVNQEIANVIGKKKIIVDSIQVNNGYITVGNYNVPLSNILIIEDLHE